MMAFILCTNYTFLLEHLLKSHFLELWFSPKSLTAGDGNDGQSGFGDNKQDVEGRGRRQCQHGCERESSL